MTFLTSDQLSTIPVPEILRQLLRLNNEDGGLVVAGLTQMISLSALINSLGASASMMARARTVRSYSFF